MHHPVRRAFKVIAAITLLAMIATEMVAGVQAASPSGGAASTQQTPLAQGRDISGKSLWQRLAARPPAARAE